VEREKIKEREGGQLIGIREVEIERRRRRRK
jgi:hypothetical protein